MSRTSRKDRPPVEKRTLILRNALTAWEKLAWNVDQLEDVQRLQNDEMQPLCYAFLDACVAAQCLQEWVAQQSGVKGDDARKSFEARIFARIPDQQMCVSIANSMKHANFSGSWPGALELVFEPSDEETSGGWVIRHLTTENDEQVVTIAALRQLSHQWFRLLVEFGHVDGPYLSPSWWTTKMRRIFGDLELPEEPAL